MRSLSVTKPGIVAGAEEDVLLIHAAREDSAAFSSLYQRYVTPVYRYLYSRLGNVADAEDLTAQVFTEALEGLHRYREQGSFSAWLFTIAHRRIVDHYRRQRPHVTLDEALFPLIDIAGPLDQAIRAESLHHLVESVTQLDEEKQELLRLRFAAGLSYGEIAAVVGSSEGAVKMAMRRLLRRLRAAWEENDE